MCSLAEKKRGISLFIFNQKEKCENNTLKCSNNFIKSYLSHVRPQQCLLLLLKYEPKKNVMTSSNGQYIPPNHLQAVPWYYHGTTAAAEAK